MTSLGQMQEAPAGLIAKAMTEIQVAALHTAIQSMLCNKSTMTAMQQANKWQSLVVEESILSQARLTYEDFVQNTLTGVGLIVSQVSQLHQQFTAIQQRRGLQQQIQNADNLDQSIQAGLDAEADAAVLGPGAVEEAAANEQAARNHLRELREMPHLEQGYTAEQREQLQQHVTLLKDNEQDRELITQSRENIRNLKRDVTAQLHNIDQKISNNIQQAQTYANIAQMTATARTSYVKSGIERLRAKLEATKTLLEFVNTALNQALQIDLSMVNQQVSRAETSIEAYNRIVSANRAV